MEETKAGKKKTVSFEEYADRCQYLKLEQRNKIIDEIKTLLKDNDSVDEAIKDMEEQQNILEEEQKKVKEDIKKAQDVVKERAEDLEKKANDWNDEVKRAATPWIRVAMRPFVVGSVYSKNTLAPGEDLHKYVKNFLQRKSSMTIMSPNGQHISFCAPGDGWKFWQGFSPFLKTLQLYAPELKGKDLDWSDLKDLSGGIYMGDRFGMYELAMSSHDRKVTIKSPFGNVEIGAFTGITINAPNGDIKIKGKNVSIEAGLSPYLHRVFNETGFTRLFKLGE